MSKKVLVVVDMQNDFIDGSLGTKEAEAIVGNVVRKIEDFRKDPDAVIFATQDTHSEEYLKTAEGRNLPVEHCIKGTTGWEIEPRVFEALSPHAVIIEKYSFGSLLLAAKVAELASEKEGADLEIELVGLCTDICVVSNALILKAAVPEARFSVDASCCAGVTPEKHQAALATMASCQIHVI